jgi:CheY-like chemotaxis protein
VLAEIFERQGLRVVRAASQEEAVERFQETHPDVVVLDIYLADGDGYGVLDELRRTGRQQIPVIVYTAHQLDATSRQRLSLGAVAFLNKGHDSPQELAARVLGVVRQMAGSPVVNEGSEPA